MLELIIKKVSNKIIIPLFALMVISGLAVTYSTTSKVSENSIAKTKENLEMLNSAMFQSLRNAMNTGDPAQIAKAEEEARNINGVSNLTVAKSKELLELFPSENSKFTTNKDILKSFDTKESQILETKENGNHNLRMIKPMIATAECLACHANQKEGDVIGIMDLTFSLNEADKEIVSLTIEILIVSTILTLITIGLIYWIVKKATNPINKLKNGFENLLESNDPNIDLSVDSKDELGEVATLFNKYMHKMREGLKQDAIVIEEVNDVLEKTKNGFYVYQVQSNASNVHVEDLKNKLNSMILSTKNTLDKINDTLRLYAESKFDAKIDDNGIYGNLASLTSGIKLVGNNTSEVLAMVMNTGNSLNQNTNILSNASRNLSISSNQQASSLEETAAALEEITSTIQSNTQSTYKMSQLAQNLTSSAQSGLELANRTAISMDEINKQVSSINEAIEVIDQIAFQTNILSLNAAVEAATAGEAGKGFAVVAQEVRNLASRSAEAAKEIKNIVEQAANKANQGKAISDDMINGYRELNNNITNTIDIISEVATASKEQEKGIVQINDAINMLDQATQKNAQVAEEISDMSQNIAQMSNSLVTTASRASFLKEAISMVSDIDLVYDTAQLKVDILNSKDKVFSNLGKYERFSVSKEANVENWINQYTQKHGDNKTLLENIKQLNDSLNNNLQNLVDTNASKPKNEILNEKAKDLELNTVEIFEALNGIKVK